MTDLQQIQRYFEYYCRRLPDPEGMRVYAEHLANGTSLATLHLAIANSDEARVAVAKLKPGERRPIADIDQHLAAATAAMATAAAAAPAALQAPAVSAAAPAPATAPPAPSPTPRTELSDEEIYLTSLYIALLGRRPDAAGVQGYLTAIRGGVALDTVVHDIYFSSEARRLNGPSKAADRIGALNRVARFGPLKRLCEGLASATLAAECQRLWQRRLGATNRGPAVRRRS